MPGSIDLFPPYLGLSNEPQQGGSHSQSPCSQIACEGHAHLSADAPRDYGALCG